MRWSARFIFAGSIILLISFFLLVRKLNEVWDQYNVPGYIQSSLRHGIAGQPPDISGEVGDKIIIMAKLEKEDTSWVAEYLPDWQRALYTVNPSSKHTTTTQSTDPIFTTPLNKGHESMAYLTYIIDNYASLPSILAFLHSHRSGFFSAWHTDTPLHSNIDALKSLQLHFVQQKGYVNLRCNWNPGCEPAHRFNQHVTPEVWSSVFAGASISQFSQRGNESFIPEQVGSACCAQFAVSRRRVLQRPKEDYEGFRTWVVETEKSDAMSGRVMEFLWHVVFGMDAVHCPDENTCYCRVYGWC